MSPVLHFSHDVTKAYLQSVYIMTRYGFIDFKADDRRFFGLKVGKMLKLELPLYGVCDPGVY